MQQIVDVRTARKCDADTIARGTPSLELMYRAGNGIFESYPWKGKVAVVCGSGNNAGDGYVLALLLHRAKIPCTIILLWDSFSADGSHFFAECLKEGVPVERYTASFSFASYTEIADCIFGTGFHGDVNDIAAEVIQKINQSGKQVICADINSGLNGDNGTASLCVRSDLTVAIGTRKLGHFLGIAKDVIRKLSCVDIGIPVPKSFGCRLLEPKDVGALFAPRKQSTHKGDYGYVSVMGGCTEYSGAVKLANLSCSALRAGCGVAQLIVPAELTASVSPYLLESTLFPFPAQNGKMLFEPEAIDRALHHQKAVSIGMGWGSAPQYADILAYVLTNASISLVIDADGLNTLARMPRKLLCESRCHVILTPHWKEFERLSGVPVEEIRKDPISVAKKYAKETGTCVLLKGPCTVITDGDTVYLTDRGCAGMATAGSGDVLSGILAGILGFAPPTAFSVACGAYLAGRAGELAQQAVGEYGMLASDTVAHIAKAIAELPRASQTDRDPGEACFGSES